MAAAPEYPFPMVLRIKCTDLGASEDADWTVPSPISFLNVIDVLTRLLPHIVPNAFDYEDEDGDRITVRSDEELAAMIEYYFWRCDQLGARSLHLEIFPKGQRSGIKRNWHSLTVNPRAAPTAGARNGGGGSGSDRKKSGDDLQALVSAGQVSPPDLSYLDVLGQGNGGTVYRALHQPSKQIIAVKVIPLDVTLEEQKQILSELEVLHQCQSPYIIGFYGSFFVENRISISTEYMDGGSLDMYGIVPEIVLGRITVAILKGLHYLWSLKIMHRDVKPSNVLVNTRGSVKLCDFGVSVQLVNSIAKTFVGTNAYMAPERVLGGEYRAQSDVWSLGMTFVELALGHFPFSGSGMRSDGMLPIELLQCIVNEDPRRLTTDQFSPPCIDFSLQCLQKSPDQRPTVDALLRHPFIVACDDGNVAVISAWVCRSLEAFRRHRRSSSSGSLVARGSNQSINSIGAGGGGVIASAGLALDSTMTTTSPEPATGTNRTGAGRDDYWRGQSPLSIDMS
ncbi:dual specificity mitogen-activated protein kinase kinase 5-like [Oscarella lobularis]|uniref:dual specificity mitogen-activated protein kinase kinase 5-like n=1 Tax=Oscarella lobularis TaxID=121494 RepID=UPI0033142E09